jgi:hypothetical protein
MEGKILYSPCDSAPRSQGGIRRSLFLFSRRFNKSLGRDGIILAYRLFQPKCDRDERLKELRRSCFDTAAWRSNAAPGLFTSVFCGQEGHAMGARRLAKHNTDSPPNQSFLSSGCGSTASDHPHPDFLRACPHKLELVKARKFQGKET